MGCGTLEGHCDILKRHVGADDYVLLPARGVFALGVGHMRRRNLQPGDKTPEPAPMQETKTVSLSGLEWKVLLSVKEQLKPEEMVEDPWSLRAAQMGLSTEEYCRTAEELDRKQVIGRFATFLEHVRAPKRRTAPSPNTTDCSTGRYPPAWKSGPVPNADATSA